VINLVLLNRIAAKLRCEICILFPLLYLNVQLSIFFLKVCVIFSGEIEKNIASVVVS
jgi:hypothetical protein